MILNLASTYGIPQNSNIVDWPISYDDMEKYYEKVEKLLEFQEKFKNMIFRTKKYKRFSISSFRRK